MRIKFITLNIFMGEFIEEAVNFLKRENPDIFVLQEVYDFKNKGLDKKYSSFQILKKEFPYFNFYYSPIFFERIDGHKINCGNVVFSRFAIKSSDTIFYYQRYSERLAKTVEQIFLTPRNLQHVIIDLPGIDLNVFDNHGVWGLDGNDNKYRLGMSKVIVEQIKDKKRVILAGDMNVDPDTQTIRNIERYLISIFKGELKSTFNMKYKPSFTQATSWRDNKGFATAVADMFFVSPDIKVIDHYCPRVDVSDHFPLVAVLEI